SAIEPRTVSSADQDRLNPDWGAIFREGPGLGGNSKWWSPSLSDIREVDEQLAAALKTELKGDIAAALHPSDYYRQYAGVLERGRRIIVVNGFHKTHVASEIQGLPGGRCTEYGPGSDEPVEKLCPAIPGKPADFWKSDWVVVSDGGCSYFDAAYDVG